MLVAGIAPDGTLQPLPVPAAAGNLTNVLLGSASRNSTTTSGTQNGLGYHGVILYLAVTVAPASPSTNLTVQLLAEDPSGTFAAYTAAQTQNSVNGVVNAQYVITPGASGTLPIGNSPGPRMICGLPLPWAWRAQVIHSAQAVESYTYSLYYQYVP